MKQTSKKWRWLGDCEDGVFYREDDSGDWVDAVRIESCSVGGGPPNKYHVEVGVLYLRPMGRDTITTVNVLENWQGQGIRCGHFAMWSKNTQQRKTFGSEFEARLWIAAHPEAEAFYTPLPVVQRYTLVRAWLHYHGLDNPDQHVVQVGKIDPVYEYRDGWNPKPTHVLRGNVSIVRWARKEFC